MNSRLTNDLIVDRDESSATLSISEESASPINAISAVRVAAIDEAVVQQLQVLLATLLVSRHGHLEVTIHLVQVFLVEESFAFLLRVRVMVEKNEVCNERRKEEFDRIWSDIE